MQCDFCPRAASHRRVGRSSGVVAHVCAEHMQHIGPKRSAPLDEAAPPRAAGPLTRRAFEELRSRARVTASLLQSLDGDEVPDTAAVNAQLRALFTRVRALIADVRAFVPIDADIAKATARALVQELIRALNRFAEMTDYREVAAGTAFAELEREFNRTDAMFSALDVADPTATTQARDRTSWLSTVPADVIHEVALRAPMSYAIPLHRALDTWSFTPVTIPDSHDVLGCAVTADGTAYVLYEAPRKENYAGYRIGHFPIDKRPSKFEDRRIDEGSAIELFQNDDGVARVFAVGERVFVVNAYNNAIQSLAVNARGLWALAGDLFRPGTHEITYHRDARTGEIAVGIYRADTFESLARLTRAGIVVVERGHLSRTATAAAVPPPLGAGFETAFIRKIATETTYHYAIDARGTVVLALDGEVRLIDQSKLADIDEDDLTDVEELPRIWTRSFTRYWTSAGARTPKTHGAPAILRDGSIVIPVRTRRDGGTRAFVFVVLSPQ